MDEQPDIEDQLIEDGKLSEGTTISGSGWPFVPQKHAKNVLSEMKVGATTWELAHEDSLGKREERAGFTGRYRMMKLAAVFVAGIRRGVNSLFSF